MRKITEREMTVFVMRRYEKKTFKEIANYYNLSLTRIRDIHHNVSGTAYYTLKKTHNINFSRNQLEGLKWFGARDGRRFYVEHYPRKQAIHWFAKSLTDELKTKLISLIESHDKVSSGIEDGVE